MNTQLIADAVRNSRDEAEATLWDRLFAFWFRRLVYTQIWEDPEADLAALQLPLGSTIVTISSGGCNALSYLTAQPAQVYAVDLNEAHLSLLKLKLAGLRAFSGYDEFWQFFGEASSPANSQLYRERLWLMLDADARAYWDKRNIVGRPRHAYFTDGFYRHGMLGRFIGLAHLLAKFARIDLTALLIGKPNDPERLQALDRLDRLFHSPLARLLTGTPALLFSLGIPPQQRALLGADAPLNEVLHQRLAAPDQRPSQRDQLFCLAGAASQLSRSRRPLPAALSATSPVRPHARRRRTDHPGTCQSAAVPRKPSGARGRCRDPAGLAGLDGGG